MSVIFARTRLGMSMYVSVVISPATTTRPVVISVSQATRPAGSSASTASSTPSEIWSAILSGCPSVTDSEVKRNSLPSASRENIGRAGYTGLAPPLPLALQVGQEPVELRGPQPASGAVRKLEGRRHEAPHAASRRRRDRQHP